jgi:23S rRNA pseudouridine2605 synthase
MQERLQKIISRAGIASRRAGEEIILAGRVRVNGQVVTELGAKADLGADTIEIDGKRLIGEAPRYIVLHKPRGVVSTLSDPEGRPTVASLLADAGTRLYPVGRLDFATSGALLITNDGDFAQGLLHPKGGVPKTYVLKVKGVMREADLERWATGVQLDDGPTRPAEVHFLRHEDDKTWFEITLREGRNQQIRRMGEATGFLVMRLARLSFAGITTENLRPGAWRPLTADELVALRDSYGVPKRIRGAAAAARAVAAAGADAGRRSAGRGGDTIGSGRAPAPRKPGGRAPVAPADVASVASPRRPSTIARPSRGGARMERSADRQAEGAARDPRKRSVPAADGSTRARKRSEPPAGGSARARKR